MRRGLENCRRVLLAQWCVLLLELGLSNGGDSMGSTACVQGQAEASREAHALVSILEGFPQDVLESFGVQENQESLEDVNLTPVLEQSTPLFSGEMRGVSSRVGLVLQGEELIRPPGSELGLWICDPP